MRKGPEGLGARGRAPPRRAERHPPPERREGRCGKRADPLPHLYRGLTFVRLDKQAGSVYDPPSKQQQPEITNDRVRVSPRRALPSPVIACPPHTRVTKP